MNFHHTDIYLYRTRSHNDHYFEAWHKARRIGQLSRHHRSRIPQHHTLNCKFRRLFWRLMYLSTYNHQSQMYRLLEYYIQNLRFHYPPLEVISVGKLNSQMCRYLRHYFRSWNHMFRFLTSRWIIRSHMHMWRKRREWALNRPIKILEIAHQADRWIALRFHLLKSTDNEIHRNSY